MTLYSTTHQDVDPEETGEWLASLSEVHAARGTNRVRYLLAMLLEQARRSGYQPDQLLTTDYVNTIPADLEPAYPGDEELEERIDSIIRWNAALMVVRANARFPGLGGHLSTFASSADLYDVGFHYFFRGKDGEASGDQIFFQGHAAPGIYARSYLEGRFDEARLDRFRRETDKGAGLSSYPHPRLMPDYWEFPTVSMGLGPIASIYQARFNRYLAARGIKDTSASRVWAFVGDGETDEPETLGALSVAAREGLDNLTWVVNCNLQRLDGPVRGNGKIVQELETVFRGAGWNVIKVMWGREWDPILSADRDGLLRRRMNEMVDGAFQKMRAEGGASIRTHLFGGDPRLLDLVSHLDDAQLGALRRGGHDRHKVYAAYKAAVEHRGRPTVILAHTVKGWDLGDSFVATNVTHQLKKMSIDELRAFRDRLQLPIPDSELDQMPYFHPGKDSPEVRYCLERRAALGGAVPARKVRPQHGVEIPGKELYEEFYGGSKSPVSTTMAFVRLFTKLLKDKNVGRRVVPIIPDEARTFGMEPLFRQVGIYAAHGQLYEPVDADQLLYYREVKDGQVLEEGINEAGSMASFQAAGTAYATHGEPMFPFYIFYSMFGMQRTGDQVWAFGDARGRGFLLGATAGRTTLNGEGLQHEDGHSHLLASAVPNLLAYDPAFAYEIAVIVEEGLRRMARETQDVFYYLTLQNENYAQLPMPGDVKEGILRGIYPLQRAPKRLARHVNLLGSGCAVNFALEAARLLAEHHGISADVWSVTSYQQLRRDALDAERQNRLHPQEAARVPYLLQALGDAKGPFIAVSDYVKLVPDMIARWLPGRLVPCGTDGFGMSDTREALRRHFEIDAPCVVLATLDALVQEGKAKPAELSEALVRYGIDPEKWRPSSL
ncbi:MAG: pyruvate dehydrogenase (acetyl-transferring), homodimeric type [Planctomycetia bacterium]